MANKPNSIPSYSEAARAAGVPIVIDREAILELGVVTWLSATHTQAQNPQTGEMGDGFMAMIEADDGARYQSFIGNVALVDVLARVDFPFRARLIKKGRTFHFAD